MRVVLLLLLASLTACVSPPPRPRVAVDGSTVRIEGRITEDTAEKFHDALAAQDIALVQLDSGGGDVDAAIAIGTEIFTNGLDVEVTGDCLSSCANYLFAAGKRKIISGPGVVGWHGNIRHLVYLHESGERVMVEPTFQSLAAQAEREAAFFALIGVDQFICWFGKIAPFNVRNFYFLSVEDMERFGIANVTARADYAETDTDYMNQLFFISNLKLLEVDWTAYEAVPPGTGFPPSRE